MEKIICFELPSWREAQKCIVYPPSLAVLKRSCPHNYSTPVLLGMGEYTVFFVSNSIFLSRLELLTFWAKMRLKVAMELLRFLTDFCALYLKNKAF